MNFESIRLVHFKCYTDAGASFHPVLNCLVGPNGAGKTNLMDALYYLCFTKSYFTSRDRFVVQENAGFLRLEGRISAAATTDDIIVKLPVDDRKEVVVNGVSQPRLSDHIGRYPAVMIAPDDNQIILGGSEVRRKFLDGAVSLARHDFLENLLAYQQLLRRRNALLKQAQSTGRIDEWTLDALDERMTAHGTALRRHRNAYLAGFLPVFRERFAEISGGAETPSILYDQHTQENALEEVLRNGRTADLRAGRTLAGPHRDDLKFGLDNRPLKTVGSQGQQKSFLVALKLALYEQTALASQKRPFLFLDDLFDKFDEHRVEHLVGMIRGGRFGQVFMTDTHEERVTSLARRFDIPHRILRIDQATIDDGER